MTGWAVGDKAVCVDTGDCNAPRSFGHLLERGRIYKVRDIQPPQLWASGDFDLGLIIDGPSNPAGARGEWLSSRFRRIAPDKHEPCEEEFVTLLKRGKVSA